MASLQDVAELRLPPLSTGTVSLSNQPAARRNAPLHQPRPGTGSFSKQIPRPSASGSNANLRVGKSVAHHLAYVSSNSHPPGFTLQAYKKKSAKENTERVTLDLSLLPKHCAQQLMLKREKGLRQGGSRSGGAEIKNGSQNSAVVWHPWVLNQSL